MTTTSPSSADPGATGVGRATGRRTRWAEVDGVPVVRLDATGPLQVGLVLGVGWRDEPFLARGVTHLLEHLVMREAHDRMVSSGASVDRLTTEFRASGSPERVADFLRRVCELLSDPPTAHLALELSVLAAEEREQGGPELVGGLLAERFGLRRSGSTAVVEPATAALGAEEVRRWAERWAVVGNAALWATGPLPDGLRLPLRRGAAPTTDREEQVVGSFPGWVAWPDAPVGFSAVVPHGAAGSVAAGVLRERLTAELRHRRGLVYDVDVDYVRLSDRERHLVVTVVPPEDREGEVVALLRGVLGDLAAAGPTPAELAEEVELFCGTSEEAEDADQLARFLQFRAECRVLGWRPEELDDMDDAARALAPADLREVFRTAERTALVVVPEGAGAEERLGDLRARPTSSPTAVAGRTYRPRWWKGVPRRARLVVGEEGVTLTTGPDHRATVRWEDVLGLLEDDSQGFTHVLVGTTTSVPLDGGDWRGGRRAMAEVLRHVPEHLRARADAHSASGHGTLAGTGPVPG